ncbi:MAG: YjjG family noncanonical pyrimidine nucleotidase [Oscillospiraceae bacterium]|nr:YjjG family noncanonical pyrimidine nucleotidase [Oscillospiraceae bacterium]
MKKYTTLLFDADDTLLDFKKAEQQALKKAFKLHDIEFNDGVNSLYQKINGKLWQDFEKGLISKEGVTQTRFCLLFNELGIEKDGIEFNKQYLSLLGGEGCIIEGADDICRRLSEKYDLYCVTNGVAATQKSRIALSGLEGFFKSIFVSEEMGWQKPRKEFFDEVFRRIPNAAPEECLIIGDSLTSDIKGGFNAGIDTCWYNPQNKPLTGDVNPLYTIHDLNELFEIL